MKVLLYSPLYYGHPAVYCRVISRLLTRRGHDVYVAASGLAANDFIEWAELDPSERQRIHYVPIGGDKSPRPRDLSTEQLLAIQREHRIDSTLFIYADTFRAEFLRMSVGAAPRLRGRSTGIFSLTQPWFPGEDQYTGKRIRLVGPTFRRTLGNIKRRLLAHRNGDKHFYEQVLLGGKLISSLVVKDERVSDHLGDPVVWMPDIYKVFSEMPTEESEGQRLRLSEDYARFLSQQQGREVLLYFGNAAWYKGYDLWLDLATRDTSVCAVHCGAPDLNDRTYPTDVRLSRETLRNEGRLFETNEFLIGYQLIKEFFCSADRIVSTHRLTGSSGTILQALELGRAVLTPSSGLLGYRTKKFSLGLTYEYADSEDLQKHWREFKALPPHLFTENGNRFMRKFSEEEVSARLSSALFG